MAEKYKLGLSRSRLFEFDNCVFFAGTVKNGILQPEAERALRMLSIKEPLITSAVVTDETGEAYVVTGACEPVISFTDEKSDAVFNAEKQKGIDFTERLFEFFVSGGNTLIICAHTVIADVKTLFVLAGEFLAFYEHRSVNVEPSAVCIFSEKADMPSNLFSPITDSVTLNLESGRQKKSTVFTADDYKKAHSAFAAAHRKEGVSYFSLGEDESAALKTACREAGIDVATAVGCAFHRATVSMMHARKKYARALFGTDLRLYIDSDKFGLAGPYTAGISVSLPKAAAAKKSGYTKAYHDEVYKKYMSAIQAFYDDTFLMQLSPSFCDSAYMYAAHKYSSRSTKKLALNYTCLSPRVMSFYAYNADQRFWSSLDGFGSADAFEPFKVRDDFSVTLLTFKNRMSIRVAYNAEKCDEAKAAALFENVRAMLAKP